MVPQVSTLSSVILKQPSVAIFAAQGVPLDVAAEHTQTQLVPALMIVALEINQVDLVHLLERDAVVRVSGGEMELRVVRLLGQERRFRGGV